MGDRPRPSSSNESIVVFGPEDEGRWTRARTKEKEDSSTGILSRFFPQFTGNRRCFELGYQFREHRNDPEQNVLSRLDPVLRAGLLGHQRVETGCAFCRRTSCIVEEFGAGGALALAIALGGI